MNTHSLRRPILGVALATGLLLLVPLVAMQFTTEVSWGPGDFLAAAVLLFAAGTAMVIGVRRASSTVQRAGVISIIALALALVWAELAVGLFR